MTRKHFIGVAEALADTLYKASDSQLSHQNVLELCIPFTRYLKSQNQAFDAERFTLYVYEQYYNHTMLETSDHPM